MGFFRWAAPAFGKFADRWTDERIDETARMLRPPEGGLRAVLDVGGGTGALAARLADALAVDVTVLDATPEMLAYLPQRPDVTGVVGTAERMPFPDDEFDAAIVSDAFHHFRDQDAAVREIVRVVRPGGRLVILEYDRRGIMRPIVLGERLLGEPAAFFAPDELCAYLRERGVEGSCRKISSYAYVFAGTLEAGPPRQR